MRLLLASFLLFYSPGVSAWGFWGHRKINYTAVFLLPPELLRFYKPNIAYLEEHAVDPDKRRYMIPQEAPRHYIDLDRYGDYPYDSLPRRWVDAVAKFSVDSINHHGIVPWWVQTMLQRLTKAFQSRDKTAILKLSADLGHYIADAHVPLHTSSNHNGQKSGQRGIHGFWESRVPELLADTEWDFIIGRAVFVDQPASFIWSRVLESAAASDSVLTLEKKLSVEWSSDKRFSFEDRNGQLTKQYSRDYTIAYDRLLSGMVERRMRQSIFAVASFWYTAYVNAGQPDLSGIMNDPLSPSQNAELVLMNEMWRMMGEREH